MGFPKTGGGGGGAGEGGKFGPYPSKALALKNNF